MRVHGFVILTIWLLLLGSAVATADDGAPPSFVPQLVLSYVDPQSGETVSCEEGCRRFEVPDGVDLEVRAGFVNLGGDIGDEGIAWDLWFDQRRFPFPGLDLDACHDASLGRVDIDCWREMNDRVDWVEWNALPADLVCVPEKGGDCSEVILRVPVDLEFDGSRGDGVYSFALWIDRFRLISEDDEFDNFRGPVRVKVVPSESTPTIAPEFTSEPHAPALVSGGLSAKPFTMLTFPAHLEKSFKLSSQKSRAQLEFAPLYPGNVVVDVQQSGTYEKMIVEIRKVSTGEALARADGKGRLLFEGKIGLLELKDDRWLEVVVIPDHGTRGVRGTIKVSYPARASYRRTE